MVHGVRAVLTELAGAVQWVALVITILVKSTAIDVKTEDVAIILWPNP